MTPPVEPVPPPAGQVASTDITSADAAVEDADAQSTAGSGRRRRMANAVRMLAVDAIQQAGSGHPGMPMGMADIAVALWDGILRHDPADPQWPDRDRFVLSNGHGSMLLYALLHLTGYDLPLDELRRFRQLHSKTPGHPEHGLTPGVETTTGPLGQGLGNAVGMALAERLLAARFNRDGFALVDHFTWVFAGDGCLMEGVSHEVCSLAGVLRLSKLVVLYDDNGISIDGPVREWFRDDTPARFEAYGWHVIADVDGHDVDALEAAIRLARDWGEHGRDGIFAPTLIQCRTQIGHGSPGRAGLAKSHGEPLGVDEVAATRKALDWPWAPFEIPDDICGDWNARARGARSHDEWRALFARYREAWPDDAQEFERRMAGRLPASYDDAFDAALDEALEQAASIATRKASQNALNHFGSALPELLGGSADLTGSNLTGFAGAEVLRTGERFVAGRYVHFGVREFGMCTALTGIALHGGFVPYGGTFLTFSDYARNAVRMAALMRQRVVYVFTHDSIGVGEDGPTHQPIEHTASLRLIPHLDVWRPCDTVESASAWAAAIARDDGPSALHLSRQNLPFVTRSRAQIDAILRGGYVLREAEQPAVVLIATGSEVALALQARDLLAAADVDVRVVSMPCADVFDRQDEDWRQAVLGKRVPRIAIEAGVGDGWWKYGCDDVISIDRFGESAPAAQLFEFFGFTPEHVVERVQAVLDRRATD